MVACGVTMAIILVHYNPYNYFAAKTVVQVPLLTPAECQSIVHMAHQAAARNVQNNNDSSTHLHQPPAGWQKQRHLSYPTVDLNWVTDGFTNEDRTWLTEHVLNPRLAPTLEKIWGIPASALRLYDLFVVRYDASTTDDPSELFQTKLRNHTDHGDISFNILLTDHFEGGGTRFWYPDPQHAQHVPQPLGHVQPTIPGTMITHHAQINHEGFPVTSGTRMILVGFTSVDRYTPFLASTPSTASALSSSSSSYTGLSWLASWGNIVWTHVRMKATYFAHLRHFQPNQSPAVAAAASTTGLSSLSLFDYSNYWYRTALQQLIVVLEWIGNTYCRHQIVTLVDPQNTTQYLRTLDDMYEKTKNQNTPLQQQNKQAIWFQGQNVYLDTVRSISMSVVVVLVMVVLVFCFAILASQSNSTLFLHTRLASIDTHISYTLHRTVRFDQLTNGTLRRRLAWTNKEPENKRCLVLISSHEMI
jgi:hypothetical protein